MAKARTARKTKSTRSKTGRSKRRTKTAAKKSKAKAAKRPAAKRAKKKVAKKSKARKKTDKKAAAKKKTSGDLLTLTEVSKRTGISMPTLQRYKKLYQSRIPSTGKGRKQRYPESALAVFEQIKKENLKKRGRPRKSGSAKAAKRKSAASRGSRPSGLISLSEIGRRTGISYPTLLRYVRLHGDRIPSHGTGRKRRFPESAVPVFQEIRSQSRRGRRKGSGTKAAGSGAGAAQVRSLERTVRRLDRQVQSLRKALRKGTKLSFRGV